MAEVALPPLTALLTAAVAIVLRTVVAAAVIARPMGGTATAGAEATVLRTVAAAAAAAVATVTVMIAGQCAQHRQRRAWAQSGASSRPARPMAEAGVTPSAAVVDTPTIATVVLPTAATVVVVAAVAAAAIVTDPPVTAPPTAEIATGTAGELLSDPGKGKTTQKWRVFVFAHPGGKCSASAKKHQRSRVLGRWINKSQTQTRKKTQKKKKRFRALLFRAGLQKAIA
mmetsp:Transcript_23204/g.58865  ORF Transcript_23204/g.58865 Transcript_23204/m.58865 type:complete len:227 (-) Transcript_23204:250-930(-)